MDVDLTCVLANSGPHPDVVGIGITLFTLVGLGEGR